MNSMKDILGTTKNILLLILTGLAETLLMVILLLLYPVELLTGEVMTLWGMANRKHQRMLKDWDLI